LTTTNTKSRSAAFCVGKYAMTVKGRGTILYMRIYTLSLLLLPFIIVLLVPVFSLAAQAPGTAEAATFVGKFNTIILFPTIALLGSVAFLVFLWGCAEYFFNATNEQAREQGVKHITWGIIGLVIMLSAFTILSIAASTFGLGDQINCANDPSAAGCENAFKVI